ncbi:MAG: GMC family oxidoreductase N-terminal domain-containing protein [Solirubrobacteraceae bacterium]
MRGNRADYDEWAAMGLAGWAYEDVLPYFRRSEDNERGECYYHGVGGPLTVSDGRSMHALVGACIDESLQAGIAPTDDHNGPTQEGAGWFQFTQRNGRRCSTAVAYLHPAVAHGNVEVLTDALGTRVLLEDGRAVGVEILRNNNLESVRAEREVIVCGGAYHSPHLLMLSGIGPADDLRALGLEARVDLPVGRNLHDHVFAALVWLTDHESLRTAHPWAAAAAPPGGSPSPGRSHRRRISATGKAADRCVARYGLGRPAAAPPSVGHARGRAAASS